MAYGQVDPASLQGDALRRWYLRSPADIEAERRSAADQAYANFFSQQISKSDPDALEPDDGGGRSDQAPTQNPVGEGAYQLAAAPIPGFWDHWSIPGCANCHGYTPGTLPPVGGHFPPFPPSYSPRSGASGGSSSSSWSDKPQCNQQFETDRKICQKAKSPECWQNSNKRLGYCSRTGEVSIPPLGFGPPGR